MFTSAKYSGLALRIGIAAVFLWFGIDKFLHPSYWVNAYVGGSLVSVIKIIHISSIQLIYLTGIFELLVGLSLVTGVFTKFFSTLGVAFLISIMFFIGLNEVTIRDIGLIGGLVALVLWPDNRSRF
jgi:uncharacterized membrane protein YphA (DoxX/SURF4 family)